ncbi:hypothetical protein [Escherichia phage Jahat_MG145]|uniref:Uncharacterized protein n=1 Tax=Escherichia phage Jahat_MG145 TaxID=2562601 RepID=A0A4D6DZV6_9CAUD|nr:hypothetical protein [Escherichia phage Jahat_MG145]
MSNKFFTVALIIKHENGTTTEIPTKFPADSWTNEQAVGYVEEMAKRVMAGHYDIEFQENQKLTNHSHEWTDA